MNDKRNNAEENKKYNKFANFLKRPIKQTNLWHI